MYTFIILLCFVPLLANCAQTLRVGHCPKPPPAEDPSKLEGVDGTWKASQDNYQNIRRPMKCLKCVLKPIGTPEEGFYKNYVYKQTNKNIKTDQTFVPNDDFTEWYTTVKNNKTGEYVKDGWVHTIVKIAGEGEEKGVLEYGCKNESFGHRSFYRFYGRVIPPNAETQKILEEAYKKVGDGSKLVKIQWDNCK